MTPFRLRLVFALLGFTAVVAQIVLMRELLVVFYGNELSLGLMLGAWLLWTAAGSALLGRIGGPPRRTVAALQAAVAVVLPLTVVAVRVSRQAFTHVPGEMLGPGPMLAVSFATLSVFCALSGWLFAAAARWYAGETGSAPGESGGAVYLWEAAGSGAGGVLAALALVPHLGGMQIALLLAAVNAIAAAAVARSVLPLVLLLALPPTARLDSYSLGRLWDGFHVVAERNSPYGNLVVTEADGTHSLFENGLISFTVPSEEAAEEAVHYALLQHPAPRTVLLIGGCAGGTVREALKHRSIERIDAVELDPAVFELARRYFPAALPSNPRVRYHLTDGRRFLHDSPGGYDAIVVNLPDPRTAQLNRFYTYGFFRTAARRLSGSGVFSFQVTGAENYLSPRRADLLRSLRKSMGEAFPQVSVMPGETVHFFGSNGAPLLRTADQFLARLKERGIATQYVREYFLPFRLAEERVRDFEAQVAPLPATPRNEDDAPVAYYFDTVLWSSRFAGARMPDWLAAAGLAALVLALLAAGRRGAVPIAVGAAGFTIIGMEVGILLGFQSVCGYVYQQLALITAALMAGLSLGAWRAGCGKPRSLLALQAAAMLAPAALWILFRAPAPQLVFPLAALGAGFLGGFQFRTAAAKAQCGPGALYGFDLLGACLGAVTLSVYVIPVFGFARTALLIAAVNLAACLVLLRSRRA